MSTDWVKASIADLIKAYQKEENLYNPKHKLYYNKQARNLSVQRMHDAVKKTRPETSAADVQRKIQTLRTQFGQEVGKIEKSRSLGQDYLYKPKIWWFEHLKWIGDYMKTRTDSTPLSAKTSKSFSKIDKHEEHLFEFADEAENSQYTTEIEYSEYESDHRQSDPPPKKLKTFSSPKVLRASRLITKSDEPEMRTIEYTLINEDTSEIIEDSSKEPEPQFVELDPVPETKSTEKYKRRSKAFGKYIATLLMEITDDKLFFELQRNITNTIQDGSIKQTELRRS